MRWVLLIWFFSIAAAFGEDEVKVSHVRILPLGDLPPYQEKLVAGKSEAIVVPFGLPPERAFVRSWDNNFVALSLRLKQFTPKVKVEGDTLEISVLPEGKSEKENWVNSKIVGSGSYLAVVRKKKEGENPDWRKVETLLLKESYEAFPVGHIRLVNTSQFPIAMKVGGERAVMVKPGGIVFRKAPAEEFEIAFALQNQEDAWKKIFDNVVNLKADGRFHVFAYDAEGKNPKRPVNFFMRPEYEEGGGLISGEEGSVEDIVVSKVETYGVGVSKEIGRDEGANVATTVAGNLITSKGKTEWEDPVGGDLIWAESGGEKKSIVIRNRGQQSAGGAEPIERFRLDVVFPLICLLVFVFLMIWWGMKWDAFARRE